MPAMVTDQEIQREMDTLRSLRRRSASSTGPGALPLDPDLPPSPNNHSTSPTSSYSQTPWSSSPPKGNHLTRTSRQYSFSNDIQDSEYGGTPPLSPGSYHLGSAASSSDDYVLGTPKTVDAHGGESHETLGGALPPAPGDDPTHLFWVPAHLHPELAPGQFRAFLKQHTSEDPTSDGEAIDGGLVRAPSSGSAPGLARTPSWLSRAPSMHAAREEGGGKGGASGLGRKRSMLSKQYHPRAGDKVEEEVAPSIDLARRGSTNRSSIYGGLYGEKGLTLQDLQKLEVMADQAAESDDPGKMRDLLRTSLSLNVSPDVLEQSAVYGSDGQAYDSPILLPPPNQIIRRNARTKIRKPGELGLGSTRGRGRIISGSQPLGEVINDDENDREFMRFGDMNRVTLHDGPPSPRRRMSDRSDGSDEMYSAEDGLTPDEMGKTSAQGHHTAPSGSSVCDMYGAYDTTQDMAEGDTSVESMTSTSQGLGSTEESSVPQSPSPPQDEDKFGSAVEHDEDVWRQKTPTHGRSQDPSRQFIVGGRQEQSRLSPPSSPETVRDRSQDPYQAQSPNTAYNQLLPQSGVNVGDARSASTGPKDRMEALRAEVAEPPHRTLEKQQSQERLRKEKEKEKKGGFFSKKKEDTKVKKGDKGSKEKEGFLGSLFGSKKKQEEPAPLKFSSAGPAAAAALLGQSKSAKSVGLIPMGGSSPTSPGFAPYARYPIHVERAVYRLSHIKLANPRRPLYEQVLISNLMFWYLSIINRSANPSPAVAEEKDKPSSPVTSTAPERKASSSPPPAPIAVPGFPSQSQQDAKKSGSLRSVPAQASAGKPSQPPTVALASQGLDAHGKRTGLTKAPEQRAGPQPGRRAEMPVRPPQYGMQNLQIDQESNRYGQSSGRSGPPAPAPSHSYPSGPNGQHPVRPPQPAPAPQVHPPPQSPRRQPSPIQSAPAQHPPPPMQYPQQHRSPSRGPETSPSLSRSQPLPPDTYQGAPAPRAIPSSHSMHNLGQEQMRRVATDRPSIQTQGLSGTYPGPEQMDRRATGGSAGSRSPQPGGYPQHAGVQPGQVFQYPGQSGGVQPGQVFSLGPSVGALPVGQSPGQVFQHPQYTPYMNQQPSAQLPPGALPPRVSQPAQHWNGQSGSPSSDASPRRSNSGGPYGNEPHGQQYPVGNPAQQRSYSGSNGPPHNQAYPDPQGGMRSVSSHGPGRVASPSQQHAYPHAPPPQQQQQPGAPYNPYLRQHGSPAQGGHGLPGGGEQRRGASDDGHGAQHARRAPQQTAQGYDRR